MKQYKEIIREKLDARQEVLIDGINATNVAAKGIQSYLLWSIKNEQRLPLDTGLESITDNLKCRKLEMESRLLIHCADGMEIGNEAEYEAVMKNLEGDYKKKLFDGAGTSYNFERALLEAKKDECREILMLIDDALTEMAEQVAPADADAAEATA